MTEALGHLQVARNLLGKLPATADNMALCLPLSGVVGLLRSVLADERERRRLENTEYANDREG